MWFSIIVVSNVVSLFMSFLCYISLLVVVECRCNWIGIECSHGFAFQIIHDNLVLVETKLYDLSSHYQENNLQMSPLETNDFQQIAIIVGHRLQTFED